ncbi:MAG TPA: PIG-L family deacetylase [Pyrinomonadaceae bacterium]|nr:PIG-L family deacetylase [Pyrinomonadaceae bacterium]
MKLLRACGIVLLFLVSAYLRLDAFGQIRPIYDQGAIGLDQVLDRLRFDGRVLMIGAHPDDEDTALLTYLARGLHARTGYLSLTRGDGGQNILGLELGEALGVIRTEELLQARRLDGGEQFFTRAYDYGFSKTLAEAKQKWDEKVVLCDVVDVIRSFRPQVVIAQFNGTPSDGHGQHQFAGYIAPLAVKAAADSSQCLGPVHPRQPWSVTKFYIRHRGQGEPTLRINTGLYDHVLGRSYFEIAMHARSQHRSQEQGVLELKGTQYSSLTLVTPTSRGKDTGIFDGVTFTSKNVGMLTGNTRDISKPRELLPRLARLVDDPLLTDPLVVDAILRASGTRIDVLADRDTVVPGESFPVSVKMFQPEPEEVKIVDVSFTLPSEKASEPAAGPQTPFRREVANFAGYFTLKIPPKVLMTQPYWLMAPRTGELFDIGGISATEPFQYEAAVARITCEVSGKRFTIDQPVEYRFADDIRGEIRRVLNVVPKITVGMDKNLLIVSTRASERVRDVSVTIRNNSTGPVTGKVSLSIPAGWTATPADAEFSMARRGESTSVRFGISIPRSVTVGSFAIKAEAVIGDEKFSQSMQTISYEHIQTHRIYRPAKVDVKIIDVQTPSAKVGYVRGSGDRVPEAIEQLGLDVEEIDDAMLAAGDLSRFQTIVIGIRAYQVRPALVSNNQRLLDFVKRGGSMVVQYQLPPTYSQINMLPFPAQMGPRVADENAPVTILDPSHLLMSYPNKLTAADFEGWVQERNLYNFSTMDPQYTGLLESHDTGEAENKGGLVVANLGKGRFVYCSYSLFRQLPAGVPGAYRLLANLLRPSRATDSWIFTTQ